ncbi:hypothetical protein [Yinghuangia seranimata]|uniref:hypothetical protein n=1 Tax=Yinghuangia seranimata TaxID=408067 RepID=UPI00248BBEF9|nr:hypothetical protein [Yinghuangia seranimata]MDI2130453.1 hypothetical protein [Yinghuangia seranimata]
MAALNLSNINRVHDDKSHTRENTLAGVTAVFGVIAIICAFFPSVHILGSWAGLAGVFVGLTAQMLSVTTLERIVIVISVGMSAVGLFINMAHGGLY